MTPAPSYETVFYDLRPAKQVERRMMIDTLQILAAGGFPIRDYQYTGMGSIYFVDFILLHRLVGMHRMLSAENDESITRRVAFNRPFAPVETTPLPIGDVVAKLDPDLKHLLWLDYDFRMSRTIVEDTVMAAHKLSPGSIFLVTVDVKPIDDSGPASSRAHYEREAQQYVPPGLSDDDFSQERLPNIAAQVLFNAVRFGLAGRRNVKFIPLFNFLYADGHPMLSIGGMIGTDTDERTVNGSALSSAPFLRRSTADTPYEIVVPRLTRKERLYLDRYMPCEDGWQPDEFEFSEEHVAQYRRIYRYYPAFAELLL